MSNLCGLILTFVPRVCNTPECIRAADMMLENMNSRQDHCVNFYERACGNFRNTHPQTATQRNRLMVEIQYEYLNQKIAEVLDQQDDSALQAVRNARAAYRQCIAESHSSAAQARCIETMKEEYPRVLLFLLATPEFYAIREKVIAIMSNIKKSFINLIQKSNWLDPVAKLSAMEKLNSIRRIAGFTTDMIRPENLQLPVEHSYKPFGIACKYYPAPHAIFVPMTVFFYPTNQLGLEALNYGGVGFLIAHEMSHTFGRDARGTIRGWSQNTESVFHQKTDCYVRQYDQFSIPGVRGKIGQATLEENIQDNVGFQVALDGYRLHVKENKKDKKLVKFENEDPEKLFMLALANSWCENVTEEYQREDLKLGYPPARHRINGMIMNSTDFGRLWNCPRDSPMNPVHKCSVWIDHN